MRPSQRSVGMKGMPEADIKTANPPLFASHKALIFARL
jgi:hypothetical protein